MAAEAASDKTKVVAAMAIRVLTGLLLLVFRTTVRAAPADAGVAADVADIQSSRTRVIAATFSRLVRLVLGEKSFPTLKLERLRARA